MSLGLLTSEQRNGLSQFSECSFFFSARCSFLYAMISNPQQAYGKTEELSVLPPQIREALDLR